MIYQYSVRLSISHMSNRLFTIEFFFGFEVLEKLMSGLHIVIKFRIDQKQELLVERNNEG